MEDEAEGLAGGQDLFEHGLHDVDVVRFFERENSELKFTRNFDAECELGRFDFDEIVDGHGEAPTLCQVF